MLYLHLVKECDRSVGAIMLLINGGLISCQVKKIPKIREKLGLVGHHLPTPLAIFYFFFETFGNMKTTQETHKKTQFPKKKIRVGA